MAAQEVVIAQQPVAVTSRTPIEVAVTKAVALEIKQPIEIKREHWEYIFVPAFGDPYHNEADGMPQIVSQLRDLGGDGWELISPTPMTIPFKDAHVATVLVFKRRNNS